MTTETATALVVSIAAFSLALKTYLVDERRKRIITAIEQNEKLVTTLLSTEAELRTRFNAESLAYSAGPRTGPFFVTESLAKDATLFGNKLETWALFVLHGMADEEVLFSTSGALFHDLTIALATFSNMPREDAVKSWPFVYELADVWHSAKRKGIAPPTFARPIRARARRLLHFVVQRARKKGHSRE